VGVVQSPLNRAQFIATRNYSMFEFNEVLYVAEALNG